MEATAGRISWLLLKFGVVLHDSYVLSWGFYLGPENFILLLSPTKVRADLDTVKQLSVLIFVTGLYLTLYLGLCLGYALRNGGIEGYVYC